MYPATIVKILKKLSLFSPKLFKKNCYAIF